MIKAIIVDDEPMAIKGLLKHIKEINYITVIGTCENAMEAIDTLNKNQVDLMFLDINMPKISGLDFLKTLKTKPITIITSAYSEYALEGYELDVIDYLVKPIGFNRFLKACNKAKDFYDKNNNTSENDNADYVFIKCDKKIEKVFFENILYVEAMNNYISVVTDDEKLITHLTLKNIEEILPKDKFIKAQKSFIVSINKIKSIEDGEIVIKNKRIPISRSNKEEIMKQILGNKFLKR